MYYCSHFVTSLLRLHYTILMPYPEMMCTCYTADRWCTCTEHQPQSLSVYDVLSISLLVLVYVVWSKSIDLEELYAACSKNTQFSTKCNLIDDYAQKIKLFHVSTSEIMTSEWRTPLTFLLNNTFWRILLFWNSTIFARFAVHSIVLLHRIQECI